MRNILAKRFHNFSALALNPVYEGLLLRLAVKFDLQVSYDRFEKLTLFFHKLFKFF
jgi:hypothetical protein